MVRTVRPGGFSCGGWKRPLLPFCAIALLVSTLLACGKPPRSQYAFDEIEVLVQGKTAGQVVELLGAPDTRQTAFVDAERWIWWSFTTLEGPNHPPELRGRTVHLEIVFRDSSARGELRRPRDSWRVDAIQGVRFRLPSALPSPALSRGSHHVP